MMMNAYDKIYLEDAMHNLGIMADYAVNVIGVPEDEFWARFLASGMANRFGAGNPDIIAGHSGAELAIEVMERTGRKVTEESGFVSISSPQYWAGWILAYYQWLKGYSFKRLSMAGLNLQNTIALFNPLHEADLSVFVGIADKMFDERGDKEWLRNYRKLNGMTQEELSEKAGVPLRLIRAYEQGTIETDHAEYRTIRRLSRALGLR